MAHGRMRNGYLIAYSLVIKSQYLVWAGNGISIITLGQLSLKAAQGSLAFNLIQTATSASE
jgi:hypothetical protein